MITRVLQALALSLTPLAAAQGADDCALAQGISGLGTWAVDTTAATTDGPSASCQTMGNDVWFTWTSQSTDLHRFDLCAGADYDTMIVLYEDDCPVITELACNDDSCALLSRIVYPAAAGSSYKLRVGGWNGDVGTATLTIDVVQDVTCDTATPISGFGAFPFDTTQAVTDGVTACEQAHDDIWFDWVSPVTDNVTVTTCADATFDTVLVVYDDACPAGAPLACNDDACSLQSSVSFSATSGVTYKLRVGGFGGQSGTGTLEVLQGGVVNDWCNPYTVGPDLVVADLPAIQAWGSVGPDSGYSMATTACNVGDTELGWFASTPEHPVIAQNVYRLEGGRFEQIGGSWVKHGFGSATGNYCCSCVNPNNGQIVGVGCSDPYGASTNGSQSGIGPRSDINPFTGVFPMPYSTQGLSGDAAYKRIRIRTDALDPTLHPTATYFGEGHYVSPGEAAAQNHFDNASWKPIEVGAFSGGVWSLSMSGLTRAGVPAIYAWQEADPEVTITPALVPGEGLFHVASRATDNGDGTWHYEYAVHNLNSDLACGSFEVPLDAGLTLTGVGFHDVDSHSGDVWQATDWSAQVGPHGVSWSTEPFALNPSANALRWGTVYNFRFDADVPPADGNVELGMFKSGGPASILAAAQVPGSVDGLAILCDPASPNASGASAGLEMSFLGSGAGSGLHLRCNNGPPGEFGFWLVAAEAGAGVPVANGVLCLVNPTGRYNALVAGNQGLAQLDSLGQFDGGGLMQNLVGTATVSDGFNVPLELPFSPPGQVIAPGDVWFFQAWFRDEVLVPGDSANFSNVLRVAFP